MWSTKALMLALTAAVSLLLVTIVLGAAPGLPSPDIGGRGELPQAGAGREQQQAEPTEPPARPGPGPESEVAVRIAADDLDSPWALAFAPDGRLFFGERPGRIRALVDGELLREPVFSLGVAEVEDGGLRGLAVDPDFAAQPYLYAMYTREGETGLVSRVVRLRLEGDEAEVDTILLDGIPAGRFHNGGAVAFGPDGLLYVATGDAGNPELAQAPESLAGKVLRLHRDGSVPADNPFPGSPVYSLGHRNPQGLAWQPQTGRLYVADRGREGDGELKIVDAGDNHGWPSAPEGGGQEYRAPVAVFEPTAPPAGLAFVDGKAIPQWAGNLVFATLGGEHLRRLEVDPNRPAEAGESERLYAGEYGRLRAVALAPDGALYVATANRDEGGSPSPHDDRILRIGPVRDRPLLYPDLRTLPPSDLRLGRETIDGASHRVLRFTNMIWNAGEGPLELAEISESETRVYQNAYDGHGMHSQRLAGEFIYHEEHSHWHFEDFAQYELWTREAFDAWVSGGRAEGQPGWGTSKTSSCLMDNLLLRDLADSPTTPVYPASCERRIQGLSVGWTDIYEYDLPEQWLDLGTEPLADGRYVLRSVVDIENLIEESPGGHDAERESPEANEALVAFTLSDGRIVVEPTPR